MIRISHSILLIVITALVTLATRAIPFLIFHGDRKMPDFIRRIADGLPPAIIAVLVIYCLKDVLFQISTTAIAAAAAIAVVIVLHLWKRSTLLSIAGGTIIYMILIRLLPIL